MPRYMKYRPRRGSQEYETKVELNGVEQDVLVIYSTQPPEPDVNIAGGLEIEGVYFEDEGCVMGDIDEDVLDALAIEIGDYNVSAWESAAEAYHERERED